MYSSRDRFIPRMPRSLSYSALHCWLAGCYYYPTTMFFCWLSGMDGNVVGCSQVLKIRRKDPNGCGQTGLALRNYCPCLCKATAAPPPQEKRNSNTRQVVQWNVELVFFCVLDRDSRAHPSEIAKLQIPLNIWPGFSSSVVNSLVLCLRIELLLSSLWSSWGWARDKCVYLTNRMYTLEDLLLAINIIMHADEKMRMPQCLGLGGTLLKIHDFWLTTTRPHPRTGLHHRTGYRVHRMCLD